MKIDFKTQTTTAVALFVFIDQITKYLARDVSVKILPFFSLESTLNTGSAFSLFAGVNFYPALISILSVMILLLLTYHKDHFHESNYLSMLFVFIFSGISGNLIDRIVFSGVRDFLSIKDLFIFNIADVYILIAVISFILHTIYHEYELIESKSLKREKTKKQ